MKTRALFSALTALLALVAATANAQTTIKINGDIYDGNGGPFKSGNVYHIISNSSSCCGRVPAGKTLTIQQNAIVKFQGNQFIVQGRMVATKAIFTSEKDDSIGGDTNGDGGKTSPGAGDWNNIEVGGTNGSAQFDGCTFRFGGQNSGPTISVRNWTGVTMTNCTIEKSGGPGMGAGLSDSKVSSCMFRNCGGVAIDNWALDRIENLKGNQSMNTGGNYVLLRRRSNQTWPATTVTMSRTTSMNSNGIFVLNVPPSLVAEVPANHKLVIPQGSVLKFMASGQVVVKGDLQVQGSTIFTSLHDDVGGDTNQSSQQPQPGDWIGVAFQKGSDASVVRNTEVRYAGQGTNGAVTCSQSNVAFDGLNVSWSSTHGVGCIPNAAPSFNNCKFTNNKGIAAVGLTWQSLGLSSNNLANNNTVGDYFLVQSHTIAASAAIDIWPGAYPNGAVVTAGRTDFGSGCRLTFHPGNVIKMSSTSSSYTTFNCLAGTLEFLGTACKPVVVTSFHDDSIAGDTNKNGNTTTPKAGNWQQLYWRNTAGGAKYTLVRYGGVNAACVAAQGSGVHFESLRVEHSGYDGLSLYDYKQTLHNLVVYKAARIGLVAGRGSHDIRHATITGCATGMQAAGFTGQVHNSIVWNNTSNYVGFQESQVHNSNGGFANKNGNINTDPKFVSESTGDLNLAKGSPCVDKASIAVAMATKKDHAEFSRILDSGLSGIARPDMGAYEQHVYSLKISGDFALGQKVTVQIQGPAGYGILALGFLNGEVYLPPFGFILLGTNPIYYLAAGNMPVGITIAVPASKSLVGASAGIQGIASITNKPNIGGVTDLCRFTLR